MSKKLIISIGLAIGLLSACNYDDECRQESRVRLRASLSMLVWDNATSTYTIRTSTPKQLRVWGLGNDSVLYNQSVSNIYLPLNNQAEQSDFVIDFHYNDTTVAYTTLDTLRHFPNPANNYDPTYDAAHARLDTLYNSGDTILVKISRIDSSFVNINGQDTLHIFYTNTENYISLECGCFVFQTLTDVQHSTHALDSVSIINQQVTTSDETHLQLYFK